MVDDSDYGPPFNVGVISSKKSKEKRDIYLGNLVYLDDPPRYISCGVHGVVAKDEIEAREKIRDYGVRSNPETNVDVWVVRDFRKQKIVRGVSLEQTVKTLKNAEIYFIK